MFEMKTTNICGNNNLLETDLVVSVSTGHVTPEDGSKLDKMDDYRDLKWPVIANLEHGSLVYVKEDEAGDDDLRANWSDDFVRLVLLARKVGATYMLLDCDAPEYDFLPLYEW